MLLLGQNLLGGEKEKLLGGGSEKHHLDALLEKAQLVVRVYWRVLSTFMACNCQVSSCFFSLNHSQDILASWRLIMLFLFVSLRSDFRLRNSVSERPFRATIGTIGRGSQSMPRVTIRFSPSPTINLRSSWTRKRETIYTA